MSKELSQELSIPENLRSMLEESVNKFSARPLLFFESGEALTYQAFYQEVNRLAYVLAKLGVKKGDIVGVMLPNMPLFPIAWFACSTLGAIMIPINNSYRSEDARYVINFSEMAFMITTPDIYLDTIVNIKDECPKLNKILLSEVANEDNSKKVIHGQSVLKLNELLDNSLTEIKPAGVLTSDIATILFTSGTTGYPKGVMSDHTHWLYQACKMVNYAKATHEDRLFIAQPFFYVTPMWYLAATIMAGASIVLMNRFSPKRFWEYVVRYRATWCNAILPNLLLQTIPSGFKNSHSLRLVACTVIPPAIHHSLEEITGVPWRANFGMTETGCDMLVPVEATEMVGTGSFGKPVQGREVRVIDAEGNTLPPGQVGEMVFQGKDLFRGYYKNREATEEAFRDGWFHTGDLVYQDESGWFYFTGRIKDMVKRSGENISSAEVEHVLVSHPKIKDAAVLAVPDDIRGEEAKAYLVLQEGESRESVTPQEIVDYCSNKLANFKIPRYFEYCKEFPRTSSAGKIIKYKLKEEKEDLRLDSYDRVDQMWR